MPQWTELTRAGDAGVRAPQAPGRWIDDPRVLSVSEPSRPANSTVGPRCRNLTVRANASWDRSKDAPADAAAAVACHHVLPGDAQAVRFVECLLERACRLE